VGETDKLHVHRATGCSHRQSGTEKPMSDLASHYAESFTVMSGRCFGLISRWTAHGQPDHCPQPVVHIFVDRTDRRWEVDACDGDAHDLVIGQPLLSRTERRRSANRRETDVMKKRCAAFA
jgi:hypothetical protein